MTEFSSIISPYFSSIPDTQAAQAASELELRLADFSVVRNGGTIAYDFPPEPAHLSVLHFAYTETTPDGATQLRRKLATFDSDNNSLVAFSSQYANRMQPIEQASQILQAGNEFMAIAPNLSSRAGLRTVAAFALFRSERDSRRFYGGLLVPKITIEQAPLIFRGILTSIMNGIGGKEELQKLLGDQDSPNDEQVIDDFLKAQNSAKESGVVLAALHLLKIDALRNIVNQLITPAQQQPTAGRDLRSLFRKK